MFDLFFVYNGNKRNKKKIIRGVKNIVNNLTAGEYLVILKKVQPKLLKMKHELTEEEFFVLSECVKSEIDTFENPYM